MRRANYHGIRDIRVEEVDSPDPGPLEVKVKIKYCGICGSDVHEYLHGPFPISSWGHEACGEIVAKGAEVTSLDIGDPVLAFGPDAYAEYLTTAAARVRKLEKSISWERAAVLEPLAGTAYAIKRGGVTAADTLLITGAGPIGLSFLNAAKAVGVATIYMTEISDTRRKKAEEMGATAVFNPREVKVPYQIRELTNKEGVDIAIEAVGVGDSLKDCLASTRYQGRVVVHGIFTERVPIHMLGFVSREVTMIGTNSIDMDQALEWAYADKIKPETIVSNIIPLDEIDVNGFGTLVTPGNKEIKILVEP
ncbi:MAG: zinc-binding dehydrogenase [Gammaproteobacteria bacterium]|nr:zinc-binding dehydrogenase [Gammaproteobacteria bacterium]